MNITTYGYENPSQGDLSKGINGWMASYNFNILRIDGHSHNGIDSALLNFSAAIPPSTVVTAGSWIVNSGGVAGVIPSSGYVQTVTAPVGTIDINNSIIKFLINTAGTRQYQQVYLFYTRLTATTFNLYSNDNTIDVLCLFK